MDSSRHRSQPDGPNWHPKDMLFGVIPFRRVFKREEVDIPLPDGSQPDTFLTQEPYTIHADSLPLNPSRRNEDRFKRRASDKPPEPGRINIFSTKQSMAREVFDSWEELEAWQDSRRKERKAAKGGLQQPLRSVRFQPETPPARRADDVSLINKVFSTKPAASPAPGDRRSRTHHRQPAAHDGQDGFNQGRGRLDIAGIHEGEDGFNQGSYNEHDPFEGQSSDHPVVALFKRFAGAFAFMGNRLTFRTPLQEQRGDVRFAQAMIDNEIRVVSQSRMLAWILGVPFAMIALTTLVLVTPISGVRTQNVSIFGTATASQQQAIFDVTDELQGQPLFSLDTQTVADLITSHEPSVTNVTVTKQWLTGLRIHADSRMPVMIVTSSTGDFLVDKEGYILGMATDVTAQNVAQPSGEDSNAAGNQTGEQINQPDGQDQRPSSQQPSSQQLSQQAPSNQPAQTIISALPTVNSLAPIGAINPITDESVLNAAKVISQTPSSFKDYVTQWHGDGKHGLRFTIEPITYPPLQIVHVEFGEAEKISEKFSVIHNLMKHLSGQGKKEITINVWVPSHPVIKAQIS